MSNPARRRMKVLAVKTISVIMGVLILVTLYYQYFYESIKYEPPTDEYGEPLSPLALAKRLFSARDYVGAKRSVDRILSGEPEDIEAKVLLGAIMGAQGRFREAQAHFSEILKEDPKNFDATVGLAKSQQALGRNDLALHTWRRATRLRKDDYQAWRGLAFAQIEARDSFGAIHAIQRSLALKPDQRDLSQVMTQILTQRNRNDDFLGQRSRGRPGFPSDPRRTTFGPSIPRPQIPDPLRDLPIPGRRRR